MKISEITKFNKDMSSTLTGRHTPNIDKILRDKGYQYIDQGHFSAAYLSPNKKTVLKINRAVDPGYEHFIKVIKTHPNKHFPAISDKKKLPDGTSAYIMERLYPLQESNLLIVSTLLYNAMGPRYTPPKKPTSVEPSLEEALNILLKYRGRFQNDIRKVNIMQRNDGTIVFIDPYGPAF